ncbi:MAG TPA: hypothetical protein PKH77_24720 [Anaerolineae bacterium]|nr:hypothetical protein [Anaerolineae bacterium]
MENTILPYEERAVHVRFEGQSWTLALAVLNLREPFDPEAVRTALANHFDVPLQKFAVYVVEQHPNGNVTVRPEAIFG